MRKLYSAAFLLAIVVLLMAGCGNKKIEMIEKSSVSLSEDGKQLDVHITLDDVNMEPETSYQVRLYVTNSELVKALGSDLFVFEGEYISHKEGEGSKVTEINESFSLTKSLTEAELQKIVEDKEVNALEIDVLNNERVFATEGIHTVE
ncbi:hypothetical protein [Bacillus sp. SG-1]|uniref:hypothetical protein n=1 Tax=Bacillus sp. SG-1 TaxID=161544 RepID=UPI0003029F27|nr:hypothetical protein [Bacillus sp. SG-1]